jgi:hypothetical protein
MSFPFNQVLNLSSLRLASCNATSLLADLAVQNALHRILFLGLVTAMTQDLDKRWRLPELALEGYRCAVGASWLEEGSMEGIVAIAQSKVDREVEFVGDGCARLADA